MYEAGDIVLVPFPFTDLSTIKQRPVIILSSRKYNVAAEDVITCGITSNPHDTQYSVQVKRSDVLDGSIPVDSSIKPDKLFTLHQKLIRKRLGKLKPLLLTKTYEQLQSILQN